MGWPCVLYIACHILIISCCDRYIFFVDGYINDAAYVSISMRRSREMIFPINMAIGQRERKVSTIKTNARISQSINRSLLSSKNQRHFSRLSLSVLSMKSSSTINLKSNDEKNIVLKKEGNVLRKAVGSITGLSLTTMRAVLGSVTGLSLTAMRTALISFTGLSLTAIRDILRMSIFSWVTFFLDRFFSIFPLWFRSDNTGVASYDMERLPRVETGMYSETSPPDTSLKLNKIRSMEDTTESLVFPTTSIVKDIVNIDKKPPISTSVTKNLNISQKDNIEDKKIIDKNQAKVFDKTQAGKNTASETERSIGSSTSSSSESISSVEANISAQIENTSLKKKENVPIPGVEFCVDDQILLAKTGMETSTKIPDGPRWAISDPSTNLSGNWIIDVQGKFMNEYEQYLRDLGQNPLISKIACSVVGFTKEEIKQEEDGRHIHIKGINPRGVWDRSFVASGSDLENGGVYEPHDAPAKTADSEPVRAEAWWENDGRVHVSWMRGGTKYGGGDFLSKRYLEQECVANGKEEIYVCDSRFYRRDPKTKIVQSEPAACIMWKFRREEDSL